MAVTCSQLQTRAFFLANGPLEDVMRTLSMIKEGNGRLTAYIGLQYQGGRRFTLGDLGMEKKEDSMVCGFNLI